MHRRALASIAGFVALIGGLAAPAPGAGAAAPPRPILAASPSDSLDDKLAEAKAALNAAQMKLAATYDKVTAAQRKAREAKAAAEHTREVAERTRKESKAAETRMRGAQKKVDKLAAVRLQLGSIDSVRTYLGAEDPKRLLERAALLDKISTSRTDALQALQRASARKANWEAAASAALQSAIEKREKAEKAAKAAEQAYQRARSNENSAQQRAEELIKRIESLRAQRSGAAGPTGDVVAPTTGTVTSSYGPRGGSIHYGLDIANEIGTPIVSAMDGKVISSGPASGFGKWVRVRHDNGLITVYGHIHSSLVSVGQQVSAGEQIAKMGSRGQSSGSHLHFEVRRSGSKVNPLVWLRSHGVSL